MSHHGSLIGLLGYEVEVRVKDNDVYDPSVLLFGRNLDTVREVEVELFYSEAERLHAMLSQALAECRRICEEFRAALAAEERQREAPVRPE